jgi:hypothetical protein
MTGVGVVKIGEATIEERLGAMIEAHPVVIEVTGEVTHVAEGISIKLLRSSKLTTLLLNSTDRRSTRTMALSSIMKITVHMVKKIITINSIAPKQRIRITAK